MGKGPASKSGLYGRRWRKARQQFLYENPLCVMCRQDGKTEAALEVDHIQKHDGNPLLFWDESNWQGLCRPHHRSYKATMERSGKVKGCDASGAPVDPESHWHRD